MTGQSMAHLLANRWAEALDADDAEVGGYWARAAESFHDAAAVRLSRTGQFKLLYDAARQGVVALNAAHGYRALGAGNHHQHTFAVGTVLAPERLRGAIAGMQVQRGIRHDLEYGAHRVVTDEQIVGMRRTVCILLNEVGGEIRRIRPALAASVRTLRCPD